MQQTSRSFVTVIQLLVFAAWAAALTAGCHRQPAAEGTQTVTINNQEPRRDTTGAIIDAHDGCLQFFNGRFYLYGTAYGRTDGHTNNSFRVYSSADLAHWVWEGELLQERPEGFYFRPCVVFNPQTRRYVLWYNWYSNPRQWNGRAGVAISDTPIGPFTIVNPNGMAAGADSLIGDGSLFVDDDGTGYFIYTSMWEKYSVRIARLTPDYLGVTGESSPVLATGCEAPILFRRHNLYYVLTDALCPFCPEGSGAQAMTAPAPLGPYAVRSNINRVTDKSPPTIAAQGTWVARIPAPGGPLFIWMADRWKSAPDGVKGDDFQFWSAPLEFKPDGDILPIRNVAQWRLSRGRAD